MKRALACLTLFLALLAAAPALADPITVTDVLGRKVTVAKPATRLILGQGRHLPTLGLIHTDPASIVVGWKEDMARDPATYALWKARFPAIGNIASVGGAADASFSVEKAISLEPDLVVLGLAIGEMADASAMKNITDRLDEAGIPVVFVDFFVKPLQNTAPSLDALGKLIGRDAQAQDFLAFYSKHLKRIADRVTPDMARPNVFMQVHAGGECCFSPGRGVFDDFITAAGGHNLGADVIPGIAGKVSLEHLIGVNPDVYVATGGAHMAARGGLVLGVGVDRPAAEASLAKLLASPGIADLDAVANKRAFGVWHMFNDMPTHILMVEALARWFHPEVFADIDPDATLAEINRRFLAAPLEGTFWAAQE